MRTLALTAALLLLTAGCIGLGDDGGADGNGDNNTTDGFDDNAFDNGSDADNDSANLSGNVSGNASFGNGTGNGTGGNGTSGWTTENRTGTVSGADLLVANTAEAEETITVENGTLVMTLNLTVDGAEVEMVAVPPGCEDSSCEQAATTSDGNASLEVQAPDGGEWTVRLTASGPGPVSADYELVIGLLAGAEA